MRRSGAFATPGGQRHRRGRLGWILLAAAVAVGALVFAVGSAPPPALLLRADRPGIGPETVVTVKAEEHRRGLSTLVVTIEQGTQRALLARLELEPRPWWRPWGERTTSERVEVRVGARHQPWLESGEAVIRVEAERAPTPLVRRPPAQGILTLPVRLEPPRVEIVSRTGVVAQGGTGLVAYRSDSELGRHGVAIGELWFPGAPVTGSEGRLFALFGVPWDVSAADKVQLVVDDELGNRRSVPILDRLARREVRTGRIQLSDAFLERVVPPIVAASPELEAGDSLLASFLVINDAMRAENRQQLLTIGASSGNEVLWSGGFAAQPGSKVMSPFVARRTYLYGGQEVDEQVHLGFDLASTRRAEVPAANGGTVTFAGNLGIYGNVVIVDHGLGLMTLYAHLSSFEVDAGEAVRKGQVLGRTGATGLAGGDHLHFAVLVRGVPVDAREWWDPRWIETRITAQLQPPAASVEEER